jgi:hypothetical protein
MRSSTCGALAALALASVPVLYFSATVAPAAGLAVPSRDDGLAVSAPDGEWAAAPSRDVQVVKAARFALAEQVKLTQNPLKLLAIKHVRQRELVDMHYSMNLLVLSEGRRRLAIAVVTASPDGAMVLTRWHWV